MLKSWMLHQCNLLGCLVALVLVSSMNKRFDFSMNVDLYDVWCVSICVLFPIIDMLQSWFGFSLAFFYDFSLTLKIPELRRVRHQCQWMATTQWKNILWLRTIVKMCSMNTIFNTLFLKNLSGNLCSRHFIFVRYVFHRASNGNDGIDALNQMKKIQPKCDVIADVVVEMSEDKPL